jgi:hypothetical protein
LGFAVRQLCWDIVYVEFGFIFEYAFSAQIVPSGVFSALGVYV